MQFRPSRRSDPDKELPAQFGGQITLDHVVTLHPEAVCFEGMADAVVVKDRATGWIEIFPIASKSTESTIGALRGFLAPGETLKAVWGDGSGEITGACEALNWPMQRSTPGRPRCPTQTSARAHPQQDRQSGERTNRFFQTTPSRVARRLRTAVRNQLAQGGRL